MKEYKTYEVKEGVELLFADQDGFLLFGFTINDFHATDWVMMNVQIPVNPDNLDQIAEYLSNKYITEEHEFYNPLTDQLSTRKFMGQALYWPISDLLQEVV